MTKRARMSTQDVIDAIYCDDDDSKVDDPDEPFMDGSDDDFSDLDSEDDFSDLDGEENGDGNDDDMDTTSHSPSVSSPVGASLTTAPPDASPSTATPGTSLHQAPYQLCGPQAYNQSPSHLSSWLLVQQSLYPTRHWKFLSCFFTTSLLQMIVDESNR